MGHSSRTGSQVRPPETPEGRHQDRGGHQVLPGQGVHQRLQWVLPQPDWGQWHLTIVPSGQEVFTVELKHRVDQSEYDIVTESVEMVDKLWRQDQELQSRFGVKLTL